MSDRYEVGYGKPPHQHRFKPGNQAARRKPDRSKAPLSVPDMLEQAMQRKRRIKRGDRTVTMRAGEIMIERLVQMMTTGTSRDLATIFAMIEKHAPRLLNKHAAELEITYHRAEGSTVKLPAERAPS